VNREDVAKIPSSVEERAEVSARHGKLIEMQNPTVLQLLLGRELRRLREARGWTLSEAVEVLGNQATKLSRLENGQSSVRPLDVRILCEALGATAEETAWAVETAKHCNQRGRWGGYRSIWGKHFRMAVDLEQDATVINVYQTELIPGLLQTEDYIRVVFAAMSKQYSSETVEMGIKARLERQQVLTRPDLPQVDFVMSESAVARQVGDDSVMRDQLDHIIEVAKRPNVHVRVLPFKARTFTPEVVFSFQMFRIQSPGKARPLEVVYDEDYEDGRYRDDDESINTYGNLWQRLVGAALSPAESIELLRDRRQDSGSPGHG
jgi:transcriptional regulator with XRE-family HTH domain